MHPCSDYSSANLDRSRLQNSRVFFFSKSFLRSLRISHARRAPASHGLPQSCSPFSASLQTFCLTARAYLNTQKIRTVLQSMMVWKFGNVGFRGGSRSTCGKTSLNKERTNIKLNPLMVSLLGGAQQHKCKASGLFLTFHLHLTWKKTQIFASANEAKLFVRASCHESI